jgi:hypothetical protein
MSKRSRRKREDVRPADHRSPEPKVVLAGPAFEQFEAKIDAALESLVERWIGVTPPRATLLFRRMVPSESVTPAAEE